MKIRTLVIFLLLCIACTPQNPFDPARYENTVNEVMPKIISFVYSAPLYTSMKDRFKPEHLPFYKSLTPKFSMVKYFVAADGTNYFYMVRPAAKIGDSRGVGGHFKINDKSELVEFREVFVTPILPVEDLKNRCAFLFDEMVKGDIAQYIKMPTYVQWPNASSVYDTVNYEWKFAPEQLN